MNLVVTCVGAPSCSVSLEPEGALLELTEDDWFDVEISGEGSGQVEISYTPTGIIVGAWSGSETTVHDRAGRKLDV